MHYFLHISSEYLQKSDLYAPNSHAHAPMLIFVRFTYVLSQYLLDKSVSNAFSALYLTLCGLYSCLMWSYVLFLREKKERVEGQVLWQAVRLISSVLCQPPRKTLKSVMLTSCNTVTLYRHRKKRWEGGREAGKQRLRQSRRDRERGTERELLTKKKIQIYTAHAKTAESCNTFLILAVFTRWLY